MSFRNLTHPAQVVQLLQRSIESGRLAHAYLFRGDNLADLEDSALALAQTLNCHSPIRSSVTAQPVDSCDTCANCLRIAQKQHPDVHWLQPESKSRIITIDQIRKLLQSIHLKPMEARYKVSVIVAADRLNPQAANAFLKTLEEPPPHSCIILLTTNPQALLDTILSRCLRLDFASESTCRTDPEQLAWMGEFSQAASGQQKSLLDRYQLLGLLITRLAQIRAQVENTLRAHSPLEQYEDIDPSLRDKWEEELVAAVEADYRRQRNDLFGVMLSWLRDIWLFTEKSNETGLLLPTLSSCSQVIAQRITPAQAVENVHRLERAVCLLQTNVQEALVLEVALLNLNL